MPTVADWSTTPAANATTCGVNIAELCASGNLNDAIRAVMAQAKAKFNAIDAAMSGTTAQPLDATLTALAGVTTAANKVIYATGVDAFTTADFTSVGRSLVGASTAAAALAALVTASSLVSPGYIKFANGLILMWGSASVGGGGAATTVTYPTAASSFSVAVGSGGSTSDTNINGPYVDSCGTTGFSVTCRGTGCTFFWFAIGV